MIEVNDMNVSDLPWLVGDDKIKDVIRAPLVQVLDSRSEGRHLRGAVAPPPPQGKRKKEKRKRKRKKKEKEKRKKERREL